MAQTNDSYADNPDNWLRIRGEEIWMLRRDIKWVSVVESLRVLCVLEQAAQQSKKGPERDDILEQMANESEMLTRHIHRFQQKEETE